MKYIRLATLQYPFYEGNIRLEHPEIREDQTYPNFPCPSTFAEVFEPEPPTFDGSTQYLSEAQPIQINGVWTAQWVVNNFTTEELQGLAENKRKLQLAINPRNAKSGSTPNAI